MNANLFAVVLGLASSAMGVGPVTNGNFDGNPGVPAAINPWTLNGTTPGLIVARSTSANYSAPYSIRIDGRGASGDGIKQSILPGLQNGGRYTTRLRIKVDAPAQVRCLLQISGAGSSAPMLLGETVVRAPQVGQWILVEGTNVVSWTGAASGAQIYLAVEQISPLGAAVPAGSFPGYNLDDVQMELDSDGDGLWDSEEIVTHPLLADTDGDGIPDKWELVHGLDPLLDEGGLDADGDGYSNVQEYWANTDPQNFSEYPGMPSDPLATAQTRALLRYLQILPSRTVAHLLDGQEAYAVSVNDYSTYVQGLANAMQTATGTARWPALLGISCEQLSVAGPLEVGASAPIGRSYMDAGGLVVLSWAPCNPWNGKFVGDKTGVDIPDLLTAGTVANLRFTGWMDQIASELALFGPDRPVIFRPFSEMNGGWDWYGHLAQADFIALWRWTYAYFAQTKGLHNIVWTYECHTQAHLPSNLNSAGVSMDYYWPGDDVVDLLGYSVYTRQWEAGFDADAQTRLHSKAFAITEGGPEKTDGLLANDYNTRYVPQIVAKYPRSAFFIIWNSFPVWNQQTQTASHNYLSILDNPNSVALLTDARVVNREAVYWRAPVGLSAVGVTAAQIDLNWTAVNGATGYRIERSADGLHAWTLAATVPLAPASVNNLLPKTTCYFRVRALYPDGDSDATDALSVTTLASLTLETNPADLISANSATLHGAVTPSGSATVVGFEYGVDTTYGSLSANQVVALGTTKINFLANLTGLQQQTTYHFRSVAAEGNQTTYGADMVFTTETAPVIPPPILTLLTGAADGISSTLGTLHGSVTPGGSAVAFWFEYGTDTTYGKATSSQDGGGAIPLDFSAALAGLQPHTTYHFRAVAADSAGTSYGGDTSFLTDTAPVARADLYATTSLKPLVLSVISNDGDADQDVLTLTAVTQGAVGGVVIKAGQLIYTPGPDFTGFDSFTYTIGDGFGRFSTAVVVIGNPVFDGLVTAPDAGAGFLTLKLAASGSFSGSLRLAGAKHALKGRFDSGGGFIGRIIRSKTTPLDLVLSLDAVSRQVHVVVSDGTTIHAGDLLNGVKQSLLAGRYTAVMPAPTDPSLPQAHGYGIMTVRALGGAVSMAGKVNDGTPFTAGAHLHADGTWVFYAPLAYAKHHGLAAGVMTFDSSQIDSDCAGSFAWDRPQTAVQNSLTTHIDCLAATYLAPAQNQQALTFNDPIAGAAAMSLQAGGLEASLVHTLSVSAHNSVTVTDPTVDKLIVKIAVSTGAFRGSFFHPNAGKKVIFSGVLQQKLNIGAGLFAVPSAGAVTFGPVP